MRIYWNNTTAVMVAWSSVTTEDEKRVDRMSITFRRLNFSWITFRESDVYWIVHHCDNWRIKNQLDATYYFTVLLIGSICFGHYYTHHQELATMMLITTLVVSFLVVCVRCSHRTHTTKNHKFALMLTLPYLQKETTNVVINIIVASSWWWA